jgi:hypothetical protein
MRSFANFGPEVFCLLWEARTLEFWRGVYFHCCPSISVGGLRTQLIRLKSGIGRENFEPIIQDNVWADNLSFLAVRDFCVSYCMCNKHPGCCRDARYIYSICKGGRVTLKMLRCKSNTQNAIALQNYFFKAHFAAIINAKNTSFHTKNV